MDSELALPELRAGAGGGIPCRVTLIEADLPAGESGYSVPDRYRHGDAVMVQVVDGGLVLTAAPETPPAVRRLVLLGNGLALYAHRSGLPVMHGTTVRLDGRDHLLVGPSGRGKSTLAAALIRMGGVLVADDVAVLVDDAVQPGIPRLKVWEDTAGAIGVDPEGLARVHPAHTKRSLPTQTVRQSRALSTIWVLGERGELAVRRLPTGEGTRALLAHHRVGEVCDPADAARWLRFVSGLVQRVPVYAVSLPDDLGRLEDGARKVVRAVG